MVVEFVVGNLNSLTFPQEVLTPLQQKALMELRSKFVLNKQTLMSIIKAFHKEMSKGLESNSNMLLMVPSYITERATGLEQGSFLALDFGGTNCRVCMVQLKGKGELNIKQKSFKFTKEQMHQQGIVLFGYLAEFVGAFVKEFESEHNEKLQKPLRLGFTFSFPVEQSALDCGTLVRWTKGFESKGVVGVEVVQLLQSCFDERGIEVKVNALVNDTVGTLLASGYSEPNTIMGLILGTGTNAAYYEKVKNIPKLAPEFAKYDEMIVNMEWGNFDSDKKVLPLTEYDEEIDQMTWNPNQQIFEKTISGYYLGELFRVIVHRFTEKGYIFEPKLAPYLAKPETLDAPMLSIVVEDFTEDLRETRKVLMDNIKLATTQIKLGDLIVVKKIGELVGYRAAQFTAAGISAVILKRKDCLENSNATVGVDGSVYEKFPFFDKWLCQNMAQLLGQELAERVEFRITKDGSGVGAALTSMIASKIDNRHHL